MNLPLLSSTIPLGPAEFDRVEAIALALAAAVDAKGKYFPSHCHGVARYCMAIAAELGIHGAALERLRFAGLLHDVGKLKVPDAILLKTGGLTPDEWTVIERHPLDGHDTLLALGLRDEARWVLHHHERGDGRGYPTGLAGESIPVASRILLVADAYDVMTTNRTYQRAMSHDAAITELQANAGGQFDDTIVEALARVLRARASWRTPAAT